MQALQLVWTGYLFLHENLLGPIAKAKSILIIWEYEWRNLRSILFVARDQRLQEKMKIMRDPTTQKHLFIFVRFSILLL